MTPALPGLLFSFYGDDFTGSTDTMESLAVAGVRTALFLHPPDPADLTTRFAGLQAVGGAGVSRAMPPEWMDDALPPLFERLRRLGALIVNYKICSTFDSSPRVGSIGRAIEIGRRAFPALFVPLLVGAPTLRRYCLFGNLFASVGDATYRLDRHPTMSRHPITPMNESDLRLHLAAQTTLPVGLLDILALTGTADQVQARLDTVLASGAAIVLFDVLDEQRLAAAGRVIWQACSTMAPRGPLFVAGSSGVGYALTAYWRTIGLLGAPPEFAAAGPAEPLLVLSGSCSPTTATQIRWALDNGFAGARLAAPDPRDPQRAHDARQATLGWVRARLAAGRNTVVYTALGPDDPAIGDDTGVGDALGWLARATLQEPGVRRLVVAGGDTSGLVVRHLGIEALEMIMPLAPGGPLCRAHARERWLDGLQIALKGGQVGQADYFGRAARGDPLPMSASPQHA